MAGIHLASYYIGIAIIFLTHMFMLVQMPSMRTHSIINLVAAVMIAYYFMAREKFIDF
jgi:hypothetical protein